MTINVYRAGEVVILQLSKEGEKQATEVYLDRRGAQELARALLKAYRTR